MDHASAISQTINAIIDEQNQQVINDFSFVEEMVEEVTNYYRRYLSNWPKSIDFLVNDTLSRYGIMLEESVVVRVIDIMSNYAYRFENEFGPVIPSFRANLENVDDELQQEYQFLNEAANTVVFLKDAQMMIDGVVYEFESDYLSMPIGFLVYTESSEKAEYISAQVRLKSRSDDSQLRAYFETDFAYLYQDEQGELILALPDVKGIEKEHDLNEALYLEYKVLR